MLAELISALPDEQAYLELLSKYKKLLMKYARMLNYEDLDAQALDNIKDGIKYINFFVDNLLATTDTETEANIMRLWEKERYTSDENSWRSNLDKYSYSANIELQKINAKKSYDK